MLVSKQFLAFRRKRLRILYFETVEVSDSEAIPGSGNTVSYCVFNIYNSKGLRSILPMHLKLLPRS